MAILDLDTIGEVLRTKRTDKTPVPPQEEFELALEAHGVPNSSQTMLSRIERGRKDFFGTWPASEHRLAVLRVYGFEDHEIQRLDERFSLGVAHLLQPRGTLSTHVSQGEKVDHVGTVSAGNGVSGVEVKARSISAPDWIAAQFDLAFVFAADVTGSSMTCEDVAKSIPEGSVVFFHRPNEKVQPRAGDIVYVHLQAEDVEVLKLFEPERGHTLLMSYNNTAKPIVVDESNPGVVQGIYLGLEAKGPRAR